MVDHVLKRKGTIYVLFSGGKDSTAALLKVLEIVPKSNVVVVFNEVTGNTAPENVQFVRKVTEELGLKVLWYKHDKDFWYYVNKYFLPGPRKRWCFRIYKYQYWRNLRGVVVTGMKSTDSPIRRKKYGRIVRNGKQIVINILWEYSNEEVIDVLKEYGYYPIPTYEKYGSNANCLFCPFYSISTIRKTMSTEYGCFLYRKLQEVYKKTNSKWEKYILERWLKVRERKR